MQVEAKALLHTKMMVPKKDAVTVQRRLLEAGFGYELALEKVHHEKKFQKETKLVAFFIDRAGYITFMETDNAYDDDFFGEFYSYPEEEISHDVVY